MIPWWTVRAAALVGGLSEQEWEQLLVAGECVEVVPHQRLAWGHVPTVMVVRRGGVRLVTYLACGAQATALRVGDVVGTRQPLACTLSATQPATLCTFREQDWVMTLHQAPELTRRLLAGMAHKALQG